MNEVIVSGEQLLIKLFGEDLYLNIHVEEK